MATSIEQLKNKIISLEATLNRKNLIIERQAAAIRDYVKEREPITNEERDSLFSQIDRLHRSLVEQSLVVDMYQQWFTKNQYWTQIHNSIMQYNPHIGQYTLEGGDIDIVIPEEEHWEVVKYIPKLSTVVIEEDEE